MSIILPHWGAIRINKVVRQLNDTSMSLEIQKAEYLGGISLTEMAKQMVPISVIQWTPYCLSLYVQWKGLFEHEHAVIYTSVYNCMLCILFMFLLWFPNQLLYSLLCGHKLLHGLESHNSFIE